MIDREILTSHNC